MANTVRIVVEADDKASGKLKGIQGALGDIGKIAGGVVVANGIMKLPGMFSSATDAAIDLGESTNAVEQIFGESAGTIKEWGKENANSFGLTQAAFQQMATPLGAMLKNAGMDMDEVTGSTLDLTARAADMASVFNTDVDSALAAISAGLRGEADPLEQYGVSLKAAAVNAKAMAMSGKDSAAALTEQEKATARVALILEQTNDVAGDFNATSDQAANAARIQAARQEELAAQIGQHLLPLQLALTEAKVKFVEVLATKVVPGVAAAAGVIKDTLAPALGFIADNSKVFIAAAVGIAAAITTAIIPATVAWIAAEAAKTAALIASAAAFVAANAPLIAIGVAIGALVAGIVLLVQHWDTITEKVPALGVATDGVKAAFDGFTAFLTGTGIPALQDLFSMFQDKILPVLGDAVKLYLLPLELAFKAAKVAAAEVLVPGLELLWGIFSNKVIPIIGTLINLYLTPLKVAFEVAKTAVTDVLVPGLETLTNFVGNTLMPKLGELVDFLEGGFELAVSGAALIVDGLGGAFKFVRDMAGEVIGKIQAVTNKLNALPSPPGWLTSGASKIVGPLGSIPGFASGTSFAPGGLALVGEGGPELVNLPRGSQVFSTQDSGRMLSGGGGQQPIVVNVYATGYVQDVDALAFDVQRALERTL